ncbi:tyrosine-type recombinase/integrase [Brevundimonas subvibrioides]|uniref:Integrase family protein n=1 Tax=Brevundimonas subvibrioides (strain ATCC 15264 / DSM 4735 / LMG 14903 / NBRC 16000 / CB 81) TaxID=633149 RepID=D9QIB5_BRESC|nr:tyrosine-type recombinase/integrase [Brevundimonas subvibrioides]ADK99417.1 integrase family protein [Brevundimonas subvibrioides ATCC 15264]
MTVYLPKNSRFWAYDFQYKRQRYHGSTGVETRRKAEDVERRIRQQAALGTLDDGSGMTWDQAAGRWWAEVGQHRASAYQLEHRLAIATRLIGPTTPISQITTRTIARAIEKRRGETFTRHADTKDRKAKRHTLSNATVNADVMRPIRRVLFRARDVWEVQGLPVIDYKALVLKEPETEIRLYSAEQQAAWSAECDPTARFVLRLLLTYGLRFGETFIPPAAFIPDAPGGPVLAINKRKRGALYLPLRADDAREIAARAGRARAAGLQSILFETAGRDAEGQDQLVEVSRSGMATRLRNAAKRAGLTQPRLIHGTRHHVGTTTLAETGDLRMVQSLLGHADIKSTLRYSHALDSGLRSQLESRNSPGAPAPEAEFAAAKQRRAKRRQ